MAHAHNHNELIVG